MHTKPPVARFANGERFSGGSVTAVVIPSQPTSIMPLPDDKRIRLAHAGVAMDGPAFSNVLSHWQFKRGTDAYQECFGDGQPEQFTEIPGELSSERTVAPGESLIVVGSLTSNITMSEHTELVIGGDISVDSTVEILGIGSLFVGGTLAGTIRFADSGSGRVWVDGNCSGSIETGYPSTEVFIQGDFDGTVRPKSRAHLLTMQIGGYASQLSIERIRAYKYTQFLASVSTSDVHPGIYPTDGGYALKQTGGRSFARWVVRKKHRE